MHIETLNDWGERFLGFAWPMLWQSSLLIAVIFALDFLMARKIRPAIRHALWIIVLVKLLLPPTLALPTGAAWWLWPAKPALAPVFKNTTVSFGTTIPYAAPPTVAMAEPPARLDNSGWAMLAAGAMSAGLLCWLVFKWLRVGRNARKAGTAHEFENLFDEARQLASLRGQIRLRLIDGAQSPAVYGLFRPVILLPRALAERLSGKQLRAVLAHEVIHVRRGDVWVNCVQTLLQIFYWWHPLLWLANARIRRLREEAVDDAVMLALRDEADAYAPTLLEVAKFAFRRPLASLGLVGILESRSALRQRIERLVDFSPPRNAGVTLLSLCGIFLFSAVALPMGQAPVSTTDSLSANPPLSAAVTSLEAGTNAIVEARARSKATLSKLNRIHMNVSYQGTRLSDVLLDLTKQAQLHDPDGKGIQFGYSGSVPGRVEETESTAIHINLTLNNVSLAQVLDAICLMADYPLKYIVEDGAVMFVPYGGSPPKYEMRTFKVDTDLFYSGLKETVNYSNILENAMRGGPAPTITYLAKSFFQSLGVNLDPPKTMFFTDRPSLLVVYATPKDLYIIERALEIMNVGTVPAGSLDTRQHAAKAGPDSKDFTQAVFDPTATLPPEQPVSTPVNRDNLQERTFQVGTSSAFYAAVRQQTGEPDVIPGFKELAANAGVDLSPPKTIFVDGLGFLTVYATKQDLDKIKDVLAGLHLRPIQIHIKARFIEVPSTADIVANLLPLDKNKDSGAGILTAPQMKAVLHQLQSQNGVEELAEPEATTITGRETKMLATETQQVITNYLFQPSTETDVPAVVPQISNEGFGPMFDVVPIALADGYTISLKAIGSRTQFFGYADPKGFTGFTTNYNGSKIKEPVTLPAVQVSSASAQDALLYDGQTLVLFPKAEQLLDCPPDKKSRERIAQHIRQAEKKDGNKTLVAFVTITLIDPAGNRINSDEDMPFAQNAIPRQPQISSMVMP
jgi:beta-lactamase regulating signal transducer with metallopeptidase domain